MNWTKLVISIDDADFIEPLCDKLCANDISEFEIIGNNIDIPLRDGELPPDNVEAINGDSPAVCIYVTENEHGNEKIEKIKQIDFGFDVKFSAEVVNEEDWANSWKQYFKPIFVGEKIIICPEWETPPENTDRIIFTINPGMSFGTGSHETTRLCIQQLERFVTSDTTVLDLGCGSGILSVIACMLGAKSAVAVDIDPNAAETSMENARKNGISDERYKAFAYDVLSEDSVGDAHPGVPQTNNIVSPAHNINGKYDIVVANIVSDIIIRLASKARELVADNGVFIAGGIITDRLDEVKAAIENSGFEIKDVEIENDWAVIISN